MQHGVYGKIQKRTTKLMAHNENDDAKMGDLVAIAETQADEPPQALVGHPRRSNARPKV